MPSGKTHLRIELGAAVLIANASPETNGDVFFFVPVEAPPSSPQQKTPTATDCSLPIRTATSCIGQKSLFTGASSSCRSP